MAIRTTSEEPRERILSACVKLFLEKGYVGTTMAEIISEAEVSNSTFQNLFHTKNGVLKDLVEFMFEMQFENSKRMAEKLTSPVYIYALEVALQIGIAEFNENIREIYLEAYTNRETAEYIYTSTSKELYKIFGLYRPECSASDFYELDLGTSGMMYSYMARPCGVYFTLGRKIERFLDMALRVYNVPEEIRREVAEYINNIDMKSAANKVVREVIEALEVKFDFEFNS